MVDLKRYYRLLPSGLCWAKKDGDGIIVYFKRFDTETGCELPPEFNHTSVELLKQERLELQQKIEAIDFILKEI
jgi:hypothetical protein